MKIKLSLIVLLLSFSQVSQATIYLVDSAGIKHGPYSDKDCTTRHVSNFKCVEASAYAPAKAPRHQQLEAQMQEEPSIQKRPGAREY